MKIDRMPQPKIILEGTHLTRKTDVAFDLAEHSRIIGERRHRWHIPLISSEWETRSNKPPTKAEPGHSMIDFQEDDKSWALECYENYLRTFELHRDYYWIVDRFHVSTMSHQECVYGRQVNLRWVDERLRNVGFVLVHLWRDPETFEDARAHRLTYSENPRRYDDLTVFLKEQDVMARLVAESTLPHLTVNVSDEDISRISSEILDWCVDVGGFWGTYPGSS